MGSLQSTHVTWGEQGSSRVGDFNMIRIGAFQMIPQSTDAEYRSMLNHSDAKNVLCVPSGSLRLRTVFEEYDPAAAIARGKASKVMMAFSIKIGSEQDKLTASFDTTIGTYVDLINRTVRAVSGKISLIDRTRLVCGVGNAASWKLLFACIGLIC